MSLRLQDGPGLRVLEGASLAPYTTFRLGGPCRVLVSCSTPSALRRAIPAMLDSGEPFVLLGSGSNVLVSDAGYDGLVLRYVADEPQIELLEGHRVRVSGATSLDALAARTIDAGWAGVDCCSGIPGTVGGAIVGNAGAWGRQVGDVLECVSVIAPAGRERTESASALGFGYRSSLLQRSDEIVLDAVFQLLPADATALAGERDRILKLRAEKHPNLDTHFCAGSFFRNIEPTSAADRRQAAGGYLEEAGAKEMRVGGAHVFRKHANIIVADDGCTAQNVFDLSRLMADAVFEKFDIRLVREVRLLGAFEGETDPGGVY